MANCTHMKIAWQLKKQFQKPNQTYPLEWSYQSIHTHDEVPVPCQKCDDCLDGKISEAVLRFTHEAQTNTHNCVITLTYNDESLPSNGFLLRHHSKKFVRSLKRELKKRGYTTKIKISIKGEYGFHNLRPHFHLIINGFKPADLILHTGNAPAPFGHKQLSLEANLYTSEFIESLWPHGFSLVGQVTEDSIKYIVRDVKSSLEPIPPSIIISGKLIEPTLPFFRIANNVSKDWLKKYGQSDAFDHDFCLTSSGHKVKVPKYYDNILKKLDPVLLDQLKEKRKQRNIDLNRTEEDITRSQDCAALRRKRKRAASLKSRM